MCFYKCLLYGGNAIADDSKLSFHHTAVKGEAADRYDLLPGVDTRKSLGCGSRRAFRASQPSSSEGPQARLTLCSMLGFSRSNITTLASTGLHASQAAPPLMYWLIWLAG